jgi:hypothetical protein
MVDYPETNLAAESEPKIYGIDTAIGIVVLVSAVFWLCLAIAVWLFA